MQNINPSNRLSQEPSPYLQQHAYNPVNWYPWGNEALERAKKEDKPILLSIGYAACHWCHVMAHESFEDDETAELMNELFINIKVDREERPDLDKIYQTAHYLLNQRSGGWPLTVFLTPDDLVPFFSGTYFPAEPHQQMPSFKEILQIIANTYHNKRLNIQQQNADLLKLFHSIPTTEEKISLDNQPLQLATNLLSQQYDSRNGGFGTAPKFPQPARLSFLLKTKPNITLNTLKHMANGGIFDQLAGGFFRYSVDAKWHIPHFEKMLYDNAQLLFLYSQIDDPLFVDVTQQTADWIIATMQSKEGGYFSSINADSQGEEGKFYVWDKDEVKKILTPKEFEFAQIYFGLDKKPNFEGKWHLYRATSLENIAKKLNLSAGRINQLVSRVTQKMLAVRKKRTAPTIDTKILTSWNALTIKGMLNAANSLDNKRYLKSANRALEFIYQKLWAKVHLFACYKDKKAYMTAYLDDYAYLIDALLTSLQITWNTDYLQFATELADTLLTHFFDAKNGGFFFTAKNHESPIYRPKTMMDEVIPSGNGIATKCLLILGHLLGETRYLEAAEKTLRHTMPQLLKYPAEHPSLLLALQEYLTPSEIMVIRAPKGKINSWRDKQQEADRYVFAIPSDATDLPTALQTKQPQKKPCAYLCQGMKCSEVIIL